VGFRVEGLGCGIGLRVWGTHFVLDGRSRFQSLGFRVWGLGFGVKSLGFRV